VSIKFCDLSKERGSEDMRAWMICSCDADGKVVVSRIQDVAFGFLSVDKIIVIDPVKIKAPIFETLASRFFD
jgi:hypothetical protein